MIKENLCHVYDIMIILIELLNDIPRRVILAPLALAPCGIRVNFREKPPPENRDTLPVLVCLLEFVFQMGRHVHCREAQMIKTNIYNL